MSNNDCCERLLVGDGLLLQCKSKGALMPANQWPFRYAAKPLMQPRLRKLQHYLWAAVLGKARNQHCAGETNWCHHWRSRRNSLPRWIGWSLLLKWHDFKVNRVVHTMQKANRKFESFFLLHHFCGSEELKSSCWSNSFTVGRRDWLTESCSILLIISTV